MRELSLNVMDIAQNSLSAGAGLITVEALEADGVLTLSITDNGRGMTPEQVKSVTDPFYTTRTTRKVGLGVPLFKMEAEMTGGGLEITSEPGVGTRVSARFVTAHVDMIPLGDLDGTMLLLITCNPERDFVYRRSIEGASYTLDTRELRGVLGDDVSLAAPDVVQWLREYLAEQTQRIKGGDIHNEDIG